MTNWNCASLPGVASCASRQNPSARVRRASARRSGATYALAASIEFASTMRSVVDSVSLAMLPTTRAR